MDIGADAVDLQPVAHSILTAIPADSSREARVTLTVVGSVPLCEVSAVNEEDAR